MLYGKWMLAIMFGFAAAIAAAEPPPMHAHEFAREDQHARMEAEREYWKREHWKHRAETEREYLKHQAGRFSPARCGPRRSRLPGARA